MCIRDRFEAAACANNWTKKDEAVSLVLALKGPVAELLQKVPPDSQNIYAELIKALELQYGDKHLRDVYCTQLRARKQHAAESLQEFEASINRLIRLAYPEAPEDFRTSFAMQTFTTGVRDNELQQVLRMERHQNSADALVHILQFEAAMSASGWASHKVRAKRSRQHRQ